MGHEREAQVSSNLRRNENITKAPRSLATVAAGGRRIIVR